MRNCSVQEHKEVSGGEEKEPGLKPTPQSHPLPTNCHCHPSDTRRASGLPSPPRPKLQTLWDAEKGADITPDKRLHETVMILQPCPCGLCLGDKARPR